MFMHNNNNYQCKICWKKALTFDVGSTNSICVPLCSRNTYRVLARKKKRGRGGSRIFNGGGGANDGCANFVSVFSYN